MSLVLVQGRSDKDRIILHGEHLLAARLAGNFAILAQIDGQQATIATNSHEAAWAVGLGDYAPATGGSYDVFHIITLGWGFELLRDGDRLLEHCKRFEPQGTYHQSIRQGLLTDWLILDCRRSIPRKLCKDLYLP